MALKYYCAANGKCQAVLCRDGWAYNLTASAPTAGPVTRYTGFGWLWQKQQPFQTVVSAAPRVSATALQPGQDSFVLQATGPLFEAVGQEEAVQCVAAVLAASSAAQGGVGDAAAREAAAALVRLAHGRRAAAGGAQEDVTAVVTLLRWH